MQDQGEGKNPKRVMAGDTLTIPGLDKQANNKVRAQRFILQVPLRYRATGDDLWRRGETENISSSGLLFTGEHFVKSSALVEICLKMPVVTAGIAAEVVCRCVVVRAVHERDADHHPVLAAKILHFRLVRP